MKKELNSMSKTVVISLGGSIIVKNTIQVEYLRCFVQMISQILVKGYSCCIVIGGGKTARTYIRGLNEATKLLDVSTQNFNSADWLGIQSTKLNAQLVKEIMVAYSQKESHIQVFPKILNTLKKLDTKKYNVFFAYGMKPGSSTDYVATRFAKHLDAKTVYNLTNIDYVYAKDPRSNSNQKPIKNLSWKEYFAIIGVDSWSAGSHSPFDIIASKYAYKNGLKVVIVNGQDLKSVRLFLEEKNGKGTVIE